MSTLHPNLPQGSPGALLPTFDEFRADAEVVEQIDAINGFKYDVFYQDRGVIARASVADELLTKGYDVINDVLRRTGIHQLHKLKAEKQRVRRNGRVDTGKAIVQFTFEHDTLHFAIAVFDDRFSITRADSSAETFYNWYRTFMPEANTVETTFRALVEHKAEVHLQIVQTQYEFRVIFGDFHKAQKKKETQAPQRNVDVLQKIIPYLPDNQGHMHELPQQDFYRIDLTFSRLERFKLEEEAVEKVRNAWYIVEAPFNENGRYLVLRTQLRNSSTELPGPASGTPTAVTEFDPDFSDDYLLAVVSFFRDRAMQGFARRLLESWSFTTSRRI